MKQTLIRVDAPTKERLTALAGDMPLAQYLREVASKPGADAPDTPLDNLRKVILKELNDIKVTQGKADKDLGMVFRWISDIHKQLEDFEYMFDYLAKHDKHFRKFADGVAESRVRFNRDEAEFDGVSARFYRTFGDSAFEITGIDSWDADMMREVLARPELLKDEDWISEHIKKQADLTDIETYKKDYKRD